LKLWIIPSVIALLQGHANSIHELARVSVQTAERYRKKGRRSSRALSFPARAAAVYISEWLLAKASVPVYSVRGTILPMHERGRLL
jgi:hypothetical protein